MIPELGLLLLLIALCFALLTAFSPLFAQSIQAEAAVLWAKAQTLCISLAYGILTLLFIRSDFTVRYVAENSAKALPWFYRATAVWGAHEGSILLWVLILSLWIACFIRFAHFFEESIKSQILSVLSFIQAGFLAFIIFTSNPFVRYFETRLNEGQDLNPLLQDPGFLIHPPILYTGYVGFAIAFAVSVVGLARKKFDWRWAAALRPWTQAAWLFLTLGITLGSWWAYRELGWGGFWFWDPVENASLMPWLSGTALLHALIMSEKRRQFYAWSILLALITFNLSLLGTFLVRSGVLISVHAFATDPARGIYILCFLTTMLVGSLSLFASNSDALFEKSDFKAISKESLLLMNNVVLSVLMATVLLGTLYPLLIQALHLGKLSVGAPYFNAIFVPITLPAIFLMASSGVVFWQSDLLLPILKRLQLPLALMFAVTVSLFFWMYQQTVTFYLGIIASVLLFAASIQTLYRAKARFRKTILAMVVAHCGLAVMIIGVTATSHLSQSQEAEMALNDVLSLGDYQFEFKGINQKNEKNYQSFVGTFSLKHHGKFIGILKPERRYYPLRQQVMTDAAIHTNLFRDIYIAIGDQLEDKHYAVRVYEKPLIRWIWFGGILMAMGAAMALYCRRQDHAN